MRNPIVRPLSLPRLARLIIIVSFVALLHGPSPALALTLEDFSVLASTAVTCTSSTIGNVGIDSGTFTDTSCTEGTVDVGGTDAQQAYDDFLAAYADLETVSCGTTLTGTLAGASLLPGVYCFDAGATLTGTLTLNGDCDDTWIFKIGVLATGALTATNFTVVNPGCDPCDNNVFWWTEAAATLTTSTVLGSILSGVDITLTGSSLDGQALATGAVTVTSNSSVSGCGGGPINVEEVSIDIKPTSCPNPLRQRERGLMSVAILGSLDLDVTDINVSTILLEGVAPISSAFEDVTEPFPGVKDDCFDCTTLGPDGITDLVLKFRVTDILAALAPITNRQCRELTLTGQLNDGTLIEATDFVITLKK